MTLRFVGSEAVFAAEVPALCTQKPREDPNLILGAGPSEYKQETAQRTRASDRASVAAMSPARSGRSIKLSVFIHWLHISSATRRGRGGCGDCHFGLLAAEASRSGPGSLPLRLLQPPLRRGRSASGLRVETVDSLSVESLVGLVSPGAAGGGAVFRECPPGAAKAAGPPWPATGAALPRVAPAARRGPLRVGSPSPLPAPVLGRALAGAATGSHRSQWRWH